MARDHFVAQTYLKHWVNPQSGMLRGYGKQSGKEFPCAPRDVCHAWDWDVNPYFQENARLLGEYRKIFEPQWNPAVAAVRSGQISAEEKFALATSRSNAISVPGRTHSATFGSPTAANPRVKELSNLADISLSPTFAGRDATKSRL